MSDNDLRRFYERYLSRCNEHRFDELRGFVADHVDVNGIRMNGADYGAGLAAVAVTVPDLHWALRRLLVDGSWLSALLVDTGTAPSGEALRFHELAMYRVDRGVIVEVWGDLDASRLT